MKIINKPIKVMAIFYIDGKVQPVKFRLDDQVIMIKRITRTYEEKIVGNKRLVFVCQHNGRNTYEIKYELDSKTWYLFIK